MTARGVSIAKGRPDSISGEPADYQRFRPIPPSHTSGSSGRKPVQVQVLSSAPPNPYGSSSDMAQVRIMYWKEIPYGVRASDASGRVSRQLPEAFQEAVDAAAMADGD